MLRSDSSPFGIIRNGPFTIIKNVVTGSILSIDFDPLYKHRQAMVKCLESWHFDVTSETNVKIKRRALRQLPFPALQQRGRFQISKFPICSFQCKNSVRAFVFTLNVCAMRRILPRLPNEIIMMILEMLQIEDYGPPRPELELRGRLLPF
jgi:hypothetical protein